MSICGLWNGFYKIKKRLVQGEVYWHNRNCSEQTHSFIGRMGAELSTLQNILRRIKTCLLS